MSGTAAAASGTGVEDKNNIWAILPGFDLQVDDPKEYGDKVRFLEKICPKKDKAMLAPRLAMLMKGTAWAQVKHLDSEKLMDPTTGVQTLMAAISTWEEAEELQVYEKFERALYRTVQRSDETTQSYVNRLAVAFNEVDGKAMGDFKAFVLLRQSVLNVEDKKKVITMVGDKLSPEKDTEVPDEETAIQWLADQGDEEALIVQDFEDQLIEVCQDNSDLAMCLNSYAEVRAKLRDKIRHRGFWPPRSGGKGKSKTGRKGGRFDSFPRKRNQSLAERIANSTCRRCGMKGHWKQECPQRTADKEEVHLVYGDTNHEPEEEILIELPAETNTMTTVENMLQSMMAKDRDCGCVLRLLKVKHHFFFPIPFSKQLMLMFARQIRRVRLCHRNSIMSAMQKTYAAPLDMPLPFPEDQELSYMTAVEEVKICRPPDIQNLRQWGNMKLPEGKNKGCTFLETVEKDYKYAQWMVNHKNLTSDWAKAKTLEQEVAILMALTSEGIRNSMPRTPGKPRFTLQDGDLSTPEGQEKLWKIVEEEHPEHIWASPECRYWGNFSRWNMSKGTSTRHKIMEVVLTTSKVCHAGLDSRYCTKQHVHSHIKGQVQIAGRWENLSAYAAQYTRGFAKNVILGMIQSMRTHELPMEVEELCVPCNGVHARDQETAAEDIVKRRRLNYKQSEDSSSPVSISPGRGASYGPSRSWKDLFKEADKLVPRVGTIQVEPQSDLFKGIQLNVEEFDVVRVDVCRGPERFRVPTIGVDLKPLTYRLTVILNRESGLVETLGNPEKWQELAKSKQIRKAKPARISNFGSQEGVSVSGKNLGEGDRAVGLEGNVGIKEGDMMMPEASMEASPAVKEQGQSLEVVPKMDEPDVEMEISGRPPKNVPRHGPQFLALSKEERDWIRQVHHRMGHPDPGRFAQFLKSTHAAENIVAGALDFQCDACLETQKGFLPTRQAAIHQDLGFNEVVGMDVVSWRNGRGVEFKFVHFLDEGTLFQQGKPCSTDTEDQLRALEGSWISWAGPPKEIYTDPAKEYTSEKFLGKLQEHGIHIRVSARDSHWQLGRTEVHGSIIKRMLDRMDAESPINSEEEFQGMLVQAFCAKNALSRVKGYTPEQAVLGISRRLPASISSDSQQSSHLLAAGDSPESDQFRLNLERRSLARKSFIEADNCNSLRRAMLRRNRPLREPFEEGDWVLYWKRKGGNLRRIRGQWHGPARIVMLEGRRICWLVHANKLIRASPEQLRPASLREWQSVRAQESKMQPVKDWMKQVVSSEFFDLGDEEIPEPEESRDADVVSSGYDPSILEPEGELTGEGESPGEEEAPVKVETNGALVPIPSDDDDDDGENCLFGDAVDSGPVLFNQFWEIDITPPDWQPQSFEDPHELVMTATELRKKRVEVKLKDLGEEDQLRFAAAKDKEVRAWLSHKTVQRVAKGKIPENAIMRCRWLLSWKGANGDEPPGELSLDGKRAKARLVVIG
eukprot:s835_g12.t1